MLLHIQHTVCLCLCGLTKINVLRHWALGFTHCVSSSSSEEKRQTAYTCTATLQLLVSDSARWHKQSNIQLQVSVWLSSVIVKVSSMQCCPSAHKLLPGYCMSKRCCWAAQLRASIMTEIGFVCGKQAATFLWVYSCHCSCICDVLLAQAMTTRETSLAGTWTWWRSLTSLAAHCTTSPAAGGWTPPRTMAKQSARCM